MPQVVNRKVAFSTPWFEVVAKTVSGEAHPHYVLEMPDYVTVFGVTQQQRVLLVKQFRPALERVTLELPSGTVDSGETPEQAARRELLEETGNVAGTIEPLGSLAPDTGREGNRLWCFFAPGVVPASPPPAPEAGIESLDCSAEELAGFMKDGRFDHALHLAVIMLAVRQGKWRFG